MTLRPGLVAKGPPDAAGAEPLLHLTHEPAGIVTLEVRWQTMLGQLRFDLDRVKYLILGIGVDVNLSPGDFPGELRRLSSSLKIEMGKPVNRAELAARILRELDSDYGRIDGAHFAALANEWESHCSTIGREVGVRVGDRQIRGRAEAIATAAPTRLT